MIKGCANVGVGGSNLSSPTSTSSTRKIRMTLPLSDMEGSSSDATRKVRLELPLTTGSSSSSSPASLPMKNVWYFCCLSAVLLIFNGIYVSQYAVRKGGGSGGRGTIDFEQRQQQQQQQQSIISTYQLPQNYSLPAWYFDKKNEDSNPKRRPTVDEPFIFFHQRKAGGSTMREQLFEAANKTEVFIPCYKRNTDGIIDENIQISCETYHTPTNMNPKPPTIYGGHLYYTSFIKTIQLSHLPLEEFAKPKFTLPQPNFTCFTVFRERK